MSSSRLKYQSGTACAEPSQEPRHEPLARRFDAAGKGCADMARTRQRSGRCAMGENAAAARARLLRVRVLREVPMGVIDLQKVVEDVAEEHRTLAAAFEIEDDMAGGMAGCRQDFDEIIEAVRPGDEIGAPGLHHRQ